MKRKLHFLLAVSIGLTTSVGWLHAEGINSLTTLKAAIESANPGATITLTGDIDVNHPDGNAGGSAITIKKAITLDGNGHSISGAAMNNILVVEGLEGGAEKDSVMTIKNLKLSNTTHNGLTVYKLDPKHKVILENVQLINNTAAGMVIRSSRVEGKNLIVHSNGWGSINLEGSDAVGDSLSLKLDANSVLAGPGQIWADHSGKGKWFTAVGWDINTSVEGKTYWTNKLSDEGKTYAADFATELQTVLGMINKQNAPINKIVLNRDIVLSDLYAAQSNIGKYSGIMNFQKTITLDGQGHTISGKFLPADGSQSYYVIKLDSKSAGSTIQNLTIEGTNATALDLITGQASNGSDTTVYVKNVNLYNNTGGGLNNNATAVVAENLHTKGNGHAVRIAVNTSRGKGYANPFFALKGNSLLEESVKIAYNPKENPDTYNQPALARSIADRLSFVNIDTQDKANWKTTWQMASLSKDFKEDNAVLVWTNELNETALAGKKLANMTDASELDSLFTFGGSTVDGIVWTAADKQELTKDITLDRSFAIIGSDTAKCVVNGHWTIGSTSSTEITLDGLTLTELETGELATPIINIAGSGDISLQINNTAINPKAKGSGTATLINYRHAAIQVAEKTTQAVVHLYKTNITLNASCQAGYFSLGKCDFSMDESKICSVSKDGSSYVYPIWLQGKDGSNCIIRNSEINIGADFYYAIRIMSSNQNVEIDHSVLYAWAGIYMQGAYVEGGISGNTVYAHNNSTITGVGKQGASNGFGVIVFEAVENSSVKMEACTVNSEIYENKAGEGFISPIVFQIGGGGNTNPSYRPCMKPTKNCSVIMNGCTVQNKAEKTTLIMVDHNNIVSTSRDGYLDYNNNMFSIKENTKVLNEDGSNSILIQNGDTLRNATKLLPYALVYQDEETKIPVAYPGDIITTELTFVKALASLNAESAIPTGYTVPDSIVIVCKDAYLVTGESAAKAFAATVGSDKPVFYLKRADNLFTTTSVGNTCVKINSNTIWDNTTNANRSVEIADGATLTINVAMSLDTVFMAESAQLVANAAVTANAVQLTYGTTKVWKAFGFPFEIGSVKNVAGDKDIKTTASTGDGVWTAGIANNAPTFTVTGGNATPAAACIIASEKDSSIVVTSTGSNLSLATKAEPNAPVTKAGTTTNFQIISNPNLSDMTLTQTAYVLSDDGKTFDRMVNPTIKAFQSFVLADEATTSTLRSLRIGDTPTGNEIVPVDGYFVETGHGTITIHTAEPTQVIVVDMLGRVHYNARVNDGAQIAVPAGIYAVNRQKVIVK